MADLVYDILEKASEDIIPDEIHKLLHINCRKDFVELAAEMIDKRLIKVNRKNIVLLVTNWESLLYKKYTNLN